VENQKEKILLVEDDRVDRLAFERHVETYGFPYEFIMAASVKEAKSALKSEKLDAAVIDYWLGDGTAFDLFSDIKDMPIVVVTGTGDEEIAVKAMKSGASDYVIKDPGSNYLKTLSATIGNAIKNKRIAEELIKYRTYLEDLVSERTEKLEKEIEDRERVAKALRESEERYRVAIEHSNDGIAIIKGDQYTYVNQKFLEIFGYNRPLDLIGKPISLVLHPDDSQQVTEYNRRMQLAEPAPSRYECKGLRKDKSTIYLEVSSARTVFLDDPVSLMFLRDVTQKKHLEIQLQQAQKLEAIGTLAGGIAHDFNNIIGVITGCAELSLLDVSKEDLIYRHLKQILNAGQRATDLVQQILTFSRQKDPDKRALKISTVLKEVLKMLRASLPATIEIKQNIAPDSGMVLADPTQIHQVLMNLCTNAAHAMRKNVGVLEVMLTNVDLTSENVNKCVDIKPGAYVKLTVSDTGTGMDRNIIERIFDPYFTTKKAGEGTGLGLAVVHGIISQYGGAIEVQSEPGKGTTFHILIPRIDHEQEMAPKKDFGELPKGSETILFIDDEKGLVDLAKKMLEYLGYQVVSSTSSIEALRLFMEGPDRFDLVITDMTMPHMTGDKLSGEILRIRPDIPIMLCTGFSEMISEDKAKSLGIREYILKPLLMNTLSEKIRKMLDHG
jgi:two-component system cell cycle sensor histidine kinase/response regulator CckA